MKNGKKWLPLTAAALSLSLLAVALGAVLSGPPGPLREGAETVSRPFLRLFSAAGGQVRQVQAHFTAQEALLDELSALRQENTRLLREARLGEQAQGENARLRTLLELESASPALSLTDAWVIARTPDAWRRAVTLDKGSAQGIREGQCVMDASGALLGRVTQAGERWSTVALVTDPAFSLAAQGSQSEALGSLEGRLDLMARGELAFTPLGERGQLGEGILTFSQGGEYPPGLLVGSVTSLEEDPGGLTPTAVVTPAADLEDLGQVFVVTAWERAP